MLQSSSVLCCVTNTVAHSRWLLPFGRYFFLIKVKARKIPYETKAFCLQQSAQFCKLHLLKSSLESDREEAKMKLLRF